MGRRRHRAARPGSGEWKCDLVKLGILVLTPIIALVVVWLTVHHPVPIYWKIDRPLWRP